MSSDQGDMRRKIDELTGEDPVLFPKEKKPDEANKKKTLEERLNAPPDKPPRKPPKD